MCVCSPVPTDEGGSEEEEEEDDGDDDGGVAPQVVCVCGGVTA